MQATALPPRVRLPGKKGHPTAGRPSSAEKAEAVGLNCKFIYTVRFIGQPMSVIDTENLVCLPAQWAPGDFAVRALTPRDTGPLQYAVLPGSSKAAGERGGQRWPPQRAASAAVCFVACCFCSAVCCYLCRLCGVVWRERAGAAFGLLFCAAKRSGAFPPNIPAGLKARVSRLGGFTKPLTE
jgi:hypothetical protein